MRLKIKICRLCLASFVPQKHEEYCKECLNPICKKNDPEYQRIKLLIEKYERGD